MHELVLEAGPPPELTPEIEAGPTLDMTLGRVRRLATSRRRTFIPAIAAAVLLAAIISLIRSGFPNCGVRSRSSSTTRSKKLSRSDKLAALAPHGPIWTLDCTKSEGWMTSGATGSLRKRRVDGAQRITS